MDLITNLLTELFGNAQTVQLAFVILAGVAIFALTSGVLMLVTSAADPLRRRLQHIDPGVHVQPQSINRLVNKYLPTSERLLPKKEAERTQVAAQLMHAGIRAPKAMMMYYAIKTLLALLLPSLVLIAIQWFPEVPTDKIMFAIAFAAMVGVMVPNIVLRRLVSKRQRALRHAFPDALDLLVVCVEAGLGLSAAIQRVGRELEVSHPALASELELVGAETRAGVKRVDALRNLADRTGLDDIRGLVTLLAQTLRFGTSVADTLRIYSEEFRDKRMQAAEETAAKIGTLLIFPLTFCMFPAFFIVAIGPAVLKVMAAFSG